MIFYRGLGKGFGISQARVGARLRRGGKRKKGMLRLHQGSPLEGVVEIRSGRCCGRSGGEEEVVVMVVVNLHQAE